MDSSDHLRVDVDDGVGRVVMDRPERHNAMDETMATDLAGALDALAADDAVRCLVLTNAGDAFNTGADLSTFDGDASDADRLDVIATPLHDAVSAMVEAPKPVVTGVDGVVAGGGLGLALAGDVVLASTDARFEFAYPRIGLSGDGGSTWLLPRLVGLRRAQALAFLDEPIGPEAAVDEGLATEAVAADAFADRLDRVAGELAAGPTLAYAEIKALFRAGCGDDLSAHLDRERERIAALAETDDYATGLDAFLGDGPAEFSGR